MIQAHFDHSLESFRFPFPTCKTYQESGWITLRRRYYDIVERHIREDHFDVTVVAGNRRIAGYIYRGHTEQRGRYYQLRMSRHEFSKLPTGCLMPKQIDVEVRLRGDTGEVCLRPMP